MDVPALIAKAEIRQAATDLRADAFNEDVRDWTAGLRLARLADADREQANAEDESVSSSAKQEAHPARSFPVGDHTHRPVIYSEPAEPGTRNKQSK